ncbi:NAD(P)H-dependent flavin oxidoreductase [Thermodesulfobacteriota bacterium]
MKRTRICEILGVKYPILQGGMLWLATAELAAAVSNAGALGIVSPLAGMGLDSDPGKNFELHINKARDLTNRPFGVNIPLDLRESGILMDVVLRMDVAIVITAAGSPANYTEVLKGRGIKVFHVVSSVKQARAAESHNVDAVIAEGVEAAARNGFDEIPLFSLVPQVADAVSIPVIAAGGIADARGLVAALALGAEGVQLGTRFVAVTENIAHEKYKRAILKAEDTGTVITTRKLLPTRNLKTEFAGRLLELEGEGASEKEIREFLGYRRSRNSQLEGDLAGGEAYGGSSAGLIHDIIPAAEVIGRLIEGYRKIIDDITAISK